MPIFHFLCTFALPAFLGIWLIGAVAAWLAKVWEETKAQEE